MEQDRGQKKLGFLGWALSGGVYCGDIRGSGAGAIGAAALGAGAFKVWRAMESAPNPEVRAKLLTLLVLFGLIGLAALAFGYHQYARDPNTDPEVDRGPEPGSDPSP